MSEKWITKKSLRRSGGLSFKKKHYFFFFFEDAFFFPTRFTVFLAFLVAIGCTPLSEFVILNQHHSDI